MSRADAIKRYCFDCAGGSPTEVTLCHLLDCPLWPFRFGYSMNDKRFEIRMRSAQMRYPEEYHGIYEIITEYLKTLPKSIQTEQIGAFFKQSALPKGNPKRKKEISDLEQFMHKFGEE